MFDNQTLLIRSEDWLKYTIRLNLLGESKASLTDARDKALADERIGRYLTDVASFHSTPVTNHKNPDLPVHKLLFLLDLGFDTKIPQIRAAVEEILKHRDGNGIYQSLTNIPKHFGGTGEDTFSWCFCDAPLLLLALLKAGAGYEEYIQPGVKYLVSLVRENGFPCAASPELGKFRGPGKKDDCCPYATLIMADLLSYIPEYKDAAAASAAIHSILDLWENSHSKHPYLFYMGTDFHKLKAPSSWYDIISVAGVLSRYESVHSDPRFREMLAVIEEKQDGEGFFTPESVYQKLNQWDFGQKKQVSIYLTYLCRRIQIRLKFAAEEF